ncbi:MAG TPA: HEXXH motif domain-containing protein [Streptosporangiaceae bacterium]|nr:HEXXH motif domain-containing protein [Streptosporangiaceae bacterium]
MTLPRHELPPAVFDEVAAGGGGPVALAMLRRAELSRRLVLLRAIVDAAERSGPGPGARARQAYDVLAAVHRRSQAAARKVLTHPSVGPRCVDLLRTLAGGRRPADLDRLLEIAAAAAVHAGRPAQITLSVRDERIVLPSLGVAAFPGAPAGAPAVLDVGPDGATLAACGRVVSIPSDPYVEAGDWSGLRRVATLARGAPLLLDDVDPFRFTAGDRPCLPRLDAAEFAAWSEVVGGGWRLLRAFHRGPASEVAAGIRALVPIDPPDSHAVSASSPETFGCVALSLPRGPRALAETFAHEIQHNKLSPLLQLYELTRGRPDELFYAPWRDDPRPLEGLFHGAYAYLGVARFWNRQRRAERDPDSQAHVLFARWRDAALDTAQVLLDGERITPLGRRFVTGMLAALEALGREGVSREALAGAARLSADHRRRWRDRNEPARP